ncbi:HAMP domain-containing sensor histidine kinase [Paenibacillus sp. UMB4589-SE434]|uniref:sensor histidine kinase n=1 Tax=Paenibacillus sp. UMB4589-SE434 TaxID=3046314 RepID=UPI0025519279|nr:HAMP domain-containing sensor histidine kinase [Paenibacillus sp. UMB4589-SE434]MDK8183929.1 HAMP domain-containing sensor histidine kinase [Paenibacillus sp. UMB4589-SE434]
MKSLYGRIVLFSVVIVMISFVVGLVVANLVYAHGLKNHYEQKMEAVGQSMLTLLESHDGSSTEWSTRLQTLSELGYQLYLVDGQYNGTMYGRPFKDLTLSKDVIESVLSGKRYRGLTEKNWNWFVPAVFENKLDMAVGFPLSWNGRSYALFARPDMVQQLQELRQMLAILFTTTFVVSLVLIALKTRYLVRPLNRLMLATGQLEKGRYDIHVDMARHDEIGELARRFTRMSQTLKQVDTMRKQFVANVSHEIQSPLTSIRGLAEQLRDRPLPPDEERRYLNIIAEESERLSSLSRQLLTLAALERGTETLKRQPFRLDEQLREVIIRMEPDWSAKQIELDLELDVTELSGDSGLLHQVWANIVGNAIKFTDNEGIICVTCKYEEADSTVKVWIHNTGAVIEKQDLPHIFDRFYKSEAANSRNRSGTGLGLAIAKRIIELHGGNITVDSSSGQGTGFMVKLPVS